MLLGHACAALSNASVSLTSAYTARLLYFEASSRPSVTSAACWIHVRGSKLNPVLLCCAENPKVPDPDCPANKLLVVPAVLAIEAPKVEFAAVVRLLLLRCERSACCCFCCLEVRLPAALESCVCCCDVPAPLLPLRLPGKLLLLVLASLFARALALRQKHG